MTEVTPAVRSCWTTSGAWVLVVAVSSGSAGDGLDHRGDPGSRQVGQQIVVEGQLVGGPVPGDHPDFSGLPSRPESVPHLTTAFRIDRLIGSGPPQVGRALVGPVGDRGPLPEERGVPLLGDAELVVTGPRPDPVEHGERGRRPFGPGLAQRPHDRLVGRGRRG